MKFILSAFTLNRLTVINLFMMTSGEKITMLVQILIYPRGSFPGGKVARA
jgi:hypothetical protein